uniref:Uncharacterized protein n=2 Tax=Paracidobacterium acidisoli TaxID=2303751 RepID=A0A372ILD1_9BACT
MTAFLAAPAMSAQNTAAGDTAQQPAARTIQMVPAKAELDKTLDAKKAKQGDAVTAKLQQDVQIPDAQTLPKSTELVGHVDQVTASEHKGDSTIVVTFDHARLKDGQQLPIKATVTAIVQPVNPMQQPNAGEGGGAPMPSASSPGGVGVPGGAGMPSGSSGAASASASQPQMSGAGMPSGEEAGQQQQQTPQNGVPGVTLKSDIHDANSATFLSHGKNVHLPDGTEMEVALAVIPAGVKMR